MTSIVVDPDTQAPEPQAQGAQARQNQTPEPEADIPEKFRGKSMKDIIEMYQNAESELGRKNNEVGVIRKLADELIGVRAAERQVNQQQTRKPITADDLFTNPEDRILEVVRAETESAVRSQQEKVDRLEASLQVQAFERKYPGFQETMTSPDFGKWLQTGSDYRKRLALAASQGNYDAADELFGLYNDYTGSRQAPEASARAAAPTGASAARQATLARSGGSTASGVVPGSGDGRKVWSRSELLDMRINRPEEFDMRQAEILQAYSEKRVR